MPYLSRLKKAAKSAVSRSEDGLFYSNSLRRRCVGLYLCPHRHGLLDHIQGQRSINFAQGEILLVGAYVVSSLVFDWHLNFILAIALGMVVTVLIGLLFERLVLRRMI